jgi:hypothetical protein
MSENKYESERHTRTDLAYCAGNVSLSFNGEMLEMYAVIDNVGATRTYNAVSGKPVGENIFDYSVDRQKQSNIGPIPEGKYWVYPNEFWKNGPFKSGSYEAWGDYRITLHPDKQTKTYGRGGFFIHGGHYPGSAGCVDLTSSMNQFYKDLMKAIGGNKSCQIPLWVDYTPKSKNRPR